MMATITTRDGATTTEKGFSKGKGEIQVWEVNEVGCRA